MMKNINLKSDYKHQGVLMSHKLIYSVSAEVADGLVSLGLAVRTFNEPDLTLEGLTWDSHTSLYASPVTPDAIVQAQD